jgi:orotate phosphoribosyltransferase
MTSVGVGTVDQLNELRIQAVRDQICKPALDLMDRQKIHRRNGHYRLHEGKCSREYLNPHEMFKTPSIIWQLAQCLIDLVPESVKHATVITGPFTGGAILAHTLAGLLDGDLRVRKIDDPPKIFVPIQIVGHEVQIKDFYRQQLAGQTVWWVDDVIRTGQTRSLCAAAIEEAGGTIVGTSAILQRKEQGRAIFRDPAIRPDTPHRFIGEFSTVDVPAGECEQCAAGTPHTKF